MSLHSSFHVQGQMSSRNESELIILRHLSQSQSVSLLTEPAAQTIHFLRIFLSLYNAVASFSPAGDDSEFRYFSIQTPPWENYTFVIAESMPDVFTLTAFRPPPHTHTHTVPLNRNDTFSSNHRHSPIQFSSALMLMMQVLINSSVDHYFRLFVL